MALLLTWLVAVSAAVVVDPAAAKAALESYDCVPKTPPARFAPPAPGRTPVLCGETTWLHVRAAVPALAPLNGSAPRPLAPTAKTCSLQRQWDLDIGGSRIQQLLPDQWIIDVNCSLPDDFDDQDYKFLSTQPVLDLACSFQVADKPVPLDVSFETFAFLPEEYDIKGLALLNKATVEVGAGSKAPDASGSHAATAPPKPVAADHHSKATVSKTPLLGIGKVARFRVDVTGFHAKERAASLRGTCVINGQNTTVSDGTALYTVQKADSDLTGLHYTCDLMDGIGVRPSKKEGVVKHKVLEIDGSEPVLDDEVFMLFSSDKPARINSVISITLRAQNLTTGYSGTCDVNGVHGVPLLEAEDHGFYMVQYTVSEGDTSREDSSPMPVRCVVRNRAGNTYTFQQDIELGFGIDTKRPKMATTSLLFSSDRPAHEGSIIEIQVTFEDEEPHLRVAHNESCLVNNASVGGSFSKSTSNAFLITYVVGKGEAHWKAGALPIHCVVQDAAGNTALIDHFTDGNTLMGRELKPIELDADSVISTEFLPDKLLIISFIIVAIASHSISQVCPHIGLPRISGYIITGILVGPYVLNFVTTRQIRQLRIIDELSMAYIGLTAGSKLHWQRMRPIMKSILAVTIGLTVIEYIIGTLTITVLAGYIDFLQDTSDSEKYAIALLAGCMMIARSPSSALAVIEETKSQGHFTTLIFAVTVMCDVLVIFLFNVNSMITESFLSEKQMSGNDLLRLILQLCGSTGVGMVLGKAMALVVFWRPRAIKRKSVWFKAQQIVKQFLILLYGWLIFVICHLAHPYLEPLLCCMVSGAVMWNSSSNPEELGLLLKKLADLVYVSFFTITGATLELDMLMKALALSTVLCFTRVAAIFLGSFLGGVAAGEDRRHCKVAWMAYITQAGVTLGLAKQIQLVYPGWGSYFSTMIVAVVICNQLLGPPMLRYVLRYVGDAKKKEIGKVDGLTALVFGGRGAVNMHSVIVRLEVCGWNVHTHEVQASLEDQKEKIYVEEVGKDVQEMLHVIKPLDVVVVMMPTDEENAQIIRAVADTCQQLKRLTVLRVVVLVAGRSLASGGSGPDGDDDETKWAAKFADMPTTLKHGDTIDVIVIDRVEATDMLIELAACGKVVNIAEKQPPSTAIAIDDGESDAETDRESVSSGVRLRRTLKHTVRRMMLV
ncbi:hypothetical protein ATCC90586_004774 [Pythium insidiosum]|nr:hypothetical protein ATCC90586_004774 [Pythium insidiosum]